MFEHPQLEALYAVVRLGSFDSAAAHLAVTPSAISQRIKQLEDRLGMILVERGQPCLPTSAAEKLLRHRDQMHLLEKTLAKDLGQSGAALATVRITTNADSLAAWLLPMLAPLKGFLFDLIIDDQDHSEAWLKRGQVAAAISSRSQALQGCDCYPLGDLRYIACASPAFVAEHFPDGITAAALSRAPALTFNAKDRLQRDWVTEKLGTSVPMPTHYIANSQAFVEAARLGIGWGLNPLSLVRDALANGDLVDLAPDMPFATPLFWHVNRLTAPALAPLTQAMKRVRLDDL
ncbi:LysR family transcriptional regulator ArgP [Gymnodinialimonas sp. 57CJ19]|uniref:LysR family transcriptional regulator ArgP n=1 Tax=Gymnodinialimonas sp. 57CJ19 TaxID=3138498 RepID=UPI0031345AEC